MKLTVAICTYRRFDWLRKCLGALKDQALPCSEFEILVVDNSLSPAESAAFRESLNGFSNLEYVITERAGLSYARNVALGKASTPYIAFIDDDAIASPNWTQEIVQCFERHPCAGVVGGKVSPLWEAPPPEWVTGVFLDSLSTLDWGEELPIHVPEGKKWLVGANVAYRIPILRAVGGFSEMLGRVGALLFAHEELAVNSRIENMGYEIWYCPSAAVDHLVQAERLTEVWFLENAMYDGASFALTEHYGTQVDVGRLREELTNQFTALINKQQWIGGTDAFRKAFYAFNTAGRRIALELLGNASEDIGSGNLLARNRVLYIVTPSMNSVATIDATILSIASQAGPFSIRYHIQDGGSTDGTLTKLGDWERRLNSGTFPILCRNVVFSYSWGADDGMYDAVNRGFSMMAIPPSGLMTWINADDILLQGAAATALAVAQQLTKEVSWLGQFPSVVNERGAMVAFYPVSYPREAIEAGICDGVHWQMLQQEGMFFRKSLWDKVGGLNSSLRYAADWDLWRRFSRFAEFTQAPWPFALFRRRVGQLSSIEGGRRYLEEIDSMIPRSTRTLALVQLATNGFTDLTHFTLSFDCSLESYRLDVGAIPDSRVPQQAKAFIDNHPAKLKDEALELNEDARTDTADVQGRQRVLFGSRYFRAAFSRMPKPIQRLIGWLKIEALLLSDATRPWRMRRAIKRSGLFLRQYYLERHQDVQQSGMDPIDHYLTFGFEVGYDPNPLFDSAWYASRNPALRMLKINPLYHFLKQGAKEGQDPSQYFSVKEYYSRHPEIAGSSVNPLLHYFQVGFHDGRQKAL